MKELYRTLYIKTKKEYEKAIKDFKKGILTPDEFREYFENYGGICIQIMDLLTKEDYDIFEKIT